MDKIYIEVFVPGIDKSYDMVASEDLTIRELADYMLRTISEFEQLNIESDDCILCNMQSKTVYRGDVSVSECKINDGSRLMLV